MDWKVDYEIGIQTIDDQHRMLLRFITQFEVLARDGAHWNDVYPVLAHTREYMRFHFSVEESLMQILRYPDAARHRAEHEGILRQITAIERGVLCRNLKSDLLPVMRHWLFNHMLVSDIPFARHALGVEHIGQ